MKNWITIGSMIVATSLACVKIISGGEWVTFMLGSLGYVCAGYGIKKWKE